MTSSSSADPALLLKARPTVAQLADRLREAPPEGLEVYLDARDIGGCEWLDELVERFGAYHLPDGFVYLVEGPIRSLDGEFFDLTVDSTANREAIARVVRLGEEIGARAACIHLIAPTDDLRGTAPDEALARVERCAPLAHYYAERCREAGLVPTVENVPPIARMREGRLMTSPIGGPPEHLMHLARMVGGLRFTVDTSHAQLFLNAASRPAVEGHLESLVECLAESSPARSFAEFLAPLRGLVTTAHVSDADGLLGEGLPYGEGSMNLDGAVDLLLGEADWLVAEILEPDPDRSPNMRAAVGRMAERRARRGARV